MARWRVRRRMAVSRRVGKEGEERALRLLRAAGYRILRTQVTATGSILVDGRRHEYRVRADALVRRRFRTYVAEFKAGSEASRVTNRATRRQLLEYTRVFHARGILLVDAKAGRVHRIEFPPG